MPDSTLLTPATGLIGRPDELARITGLLAPAHPGDRTLVLTGDRGAGKSRLLATAAQHARDSGRYRVVLVPAVGDEPALIRHLLLAFRRELDDRTILSGLDATPDVAGLAALRPVARAAVAAANRRMPVLLVADDIQHLGADAATLLAELRDDVSARVLAGHGPIPAALAGLPRLEVAPLSPAYAVRLLDAQEPAPAPRARAEILRRAAGNPAAIVELSAGEGRLQSGFAATIRGLPEPVRRLLLHLAAATPPAGARMVLAAAGLDDPDLWRPAERAGLVRLTGDTAAFTHPLAAEAAYRPEPVSARQAAHQRLAAHRTGAPEWQALHRAAATSGRDETVAAALESAAGIFRARQDLFEAARAMERAADRSPRAETAARRFARAAADARNLSEPDWTGELYAAVRRLTHDPDLIATAAHAAATALSRSGRQHEAFAVLTAARRAGSPADPATMLSMTGLAAALAAISGREEHRLELAGMLAESELGLDPATAVFVRLIMDPASHPGRAFCETAAPQPGTVLSPADRVRLGILGTIAGYEDRSRLAADVLRAVAGSSLSGVETVPVLIGALIDTGEWARAEQRADAAVGVGLPVFTANVAALRAQLHALRGDADRALRLARQAWSMLDIQQHRSVHVRLLRATGLAAMSRGDYDDAYRQFRSMFDRDGRPLHTFLAGRCVGELAAAAVRSGHRDDIGPIVERVRADAGDEPSARMRLLLHLTDALLADGDRAEHHFRLATVDAAGEEWPYERAVARLHYGEWLRRARRPRDARGVLGAAARTFAELGAGPAAELAARELRAGGQQSGPAGRGVLGALTPQEEQVARLAAQGLRNREIAEQLFISVRTVGAHLTSVYPKLGIGGRHQLSESLPQEVGALTDGRL
ncbi:helix-turn-helix transcriptional regulator [Paractinoplanes maris]|uniref:helix-turn-helix transcriptional regulator n=1 Tax=Paractinoplanes maris TaxID=1734446 RepID=UPI00201FBDF6|nr:LuxR family transcriptional regulator [Actinoplanes maris]